MPTAHQLELDAARLGHAIMELGEADLAGNAAPRAELRRRIDDMLQVLDALDRLDG